MARVNEFFEVVKHDKIIIRQQFKITMKMMMFEDFQSHAVIL